MNPWLGERVAALDFGAPSGNSAPTVDSTASALEK